MQRNKVAWSYSFGIIVILIAVACGGAATATSVVATPPPASPPPAGPSPELIQHVVTPQAGATVIANAHDNEETQTSAEKSVRGGDDFRINRFERPFTTNDMEYEPQIDIVGMSMSKDDIWYYVQIKLSGVNPKTSDLDGQYGVEFDLNVDGKTEVMLLAQGPFTSAWTQQGVVAYADSNGDIGGISSKPDDIYTGNGYDQIVFDSGKGDDPDGAWARENKDSAVVEIAFKQETLRDYSKWMWNVLASATPLDPTKFYFNDTFTPQRAGSPDKGDSNYPLKELAGFDNTCRVPAGFQAVGNEPMGCSVSHEQPDIQYTGYPQ